MRYIFRLFTQIKRILKTEHTKVSRNKRLEILARYSWVQTTEAAVRAAVSAFCFGSFWTFGGQGPRTIGYAWEPSEKLEGACCCQARNREGEPPGYGAKEALVASNEHD